MKPFDGLAIAQEIAANKGGKCLSDKYTNNTTKMIFICKNNHTWKTTLQNIRNHNSWCPRCITGKDPLDIIKNIAISNGGKCISNTYINSSTKLLFECSKGHIWNATPNHIKSNNSWCPKCSQIDKSKKQMLDNGLDICQDYASQYNGEVISTEYIGYHKKYTWRCNNNHTFNMTLGNVTSGQWCPKCRKRISKKHWDLYQIIKKLYPDCLVENNYNKFIWLKGKKGRKQELDIYIHELKIAIEYDGEQHFVPVRFGPPDEAVRKLKYTQELDKIKNEKIKDNKNDVKYFIRFNYKEPINEIYVENKLKKYGCL